MRPTLRPLLPLLLIVGAVPFLAGCSGDSDADGTGPTVLATGPHEPTTPAASATPTEPTSPTSSATALAPQVAAVCAPYSVMVAAIEDAAATTSDREEIAAAIAPVMEQFAASIAALQRPPGLPAATWAGVVALAHKIRALPAHPSTEDIEAVEEQLTADQREAVEAAADWFRASCGA